MAPTFVALNSRIPAYRSATLARPCVLSFLIESCVIVLVDPALMTSTMSLVSSRPY